MSLDAVYRLCGAEACQRVRRAAGVSHVSLQKKHGVLVGALRWRELVIRTGHQGLAAIERRQLILFVVAGIVVFAVFSFFGFGSSVSLSSVFKPVTDLRGGQSGGLRQFSFLPGGRIRVMGVPLP